MKKLRLRLICLLLSLCLLCGMGMMPVSAAQAAPPDAATAFFYDLADALVKSLLRCVALLFPNFDIPSAYSGSADFYPGMDAFLGAPLPEAQWHVGYASASLLQGQNVFDGKHYVGGGLIGEGQRLLIDEKTPTVLLDDQRVRVTAINDGSGRGTVIFASLDAFGLTSPDVRAIRALLRDFAVENNIVSINVSALHQHSVIDTMGMNAPLLKALFLNPLANATGLFAPRSGKNTGFMKHLHHVTAAAIREAVAALAPGTLYYSKTNIREYMHDKREPIVFDEYAHRLRFVPSAPGSKETWLCNLAIHCLGTGASPRAVTGDFPYYMEETVNAAGANFQLIQGAQLAITCETSTGGAQSDDRFERMQAYGRALGAKLTGIPAAAETEVTPLLNVRHAEYSFAVDNPLHIIFFRAGLVSATVEKTDALGWNMRLWTEVGYVTFGESLAAAIVPGELEPALAYGGGLDAARAWRGTNYALQSMQETIGDCALLIFGLTNDQSGYILLPNDVRSFVLFGNEEINAASAQAAPALLKAFGHLVKNMEF
ncbi:MAG: hypothetical protein LBC83_02045 [Oscillospiraceae bacterium]|jgi:hypothetical protein|nr:hypothetical protein [Oscillospiraceae bacterium]